MEANGEEVNMSPSDIASRLGITRASVTGLLGLDGETRVNRKIPPF